MLRRYSLEILNGCEQGVSYFLFTRVYVNDGAGPVHADSVKAAVL